MKGQVRSMQHRLGLVAEYSQLPVEVEVEGKAYYVIKNAQDEFTLVSRRCPHAGAKVEYDSGEFECPMHGWTFDGKTGACLNIPSKSLQTYPITVVDGVLVVSLGFE